MTVSNDDGDSVAQNTADGEAKQICDETVSSAPDRTEEETTSGMEKKILTREVRQQRNH